MWLLHLPYERRIRRGSGPRQAAVGLVRVAERCAPVIRRSPDTAAALCPCQSLSLLTLMRMNPRRAPRRVLHLPRGRRPCLVGLHMRGLVLTLHLVVRQSAMGVEGAAILLPVVEVAGASARPVAVVALSSTSAHCHLWRLHVAMAVLLYRERATSRVNLFCALAWLTLALRQTLARSQLRPR